MEAALSWIRAAFAAMLDSGFGTERVVPVGIFLHGGERPASLTLGGDSYQFLSFRYLACTLNALPWQDWRDSDNLVARLNLPNMRYRRDERIHVYARAVRGLMELEPDPEKRLKYADFIDIYAGLTEGKYEAGGRTVPQSRPELRFARTENVAMQDLNIPRAFCQGEKQQLGMCVAVSLISGKR